MANDPVSLRVDGLKELKLRFDAVDKEGQKRMARAINLNAMDYRRAVTKSISKRTGRHRRYKRGSKVHWSSSPQRAPNSDTGTLRKNIRITTRAVQSRQVAAIVSHAKYSKALEFGHKVSRRGGRRTNFVTAARISQGVSRVAPRPFMFPMLRKMNRQFVARMKQAIRGIL